jgi:DNA-binding transcriptional regulator YiaG
MTPKNIIISINAVSDDVASSNEGVDMQQLQDKIKILRTKLGWSQETLARKIDVSLSTVQRWELKGTRPIKLAQKELEKLFKKAGMKGPDNG